MEEGWLQVSSAPLIFYLTATLTKQTMKGWLYTRDYITTTLIHTTALLLVIPDNKTSGIAFAATLSLIIFDFLSLFYKSTHEMESFLLSFCSFKTTAFSADMFNVFLSLDLKSSIGQNG